MKKKLKKEVSYVYPPVNQWRKAPKQFLQLLLAENQMVIWEEDCVLYLIVMYGGVLRMHRFIVNAPRPEGFSLVHREIYPPVSEWEKTKAYDDIKLKDGEYTIITHKTTGRGLYLLARDEGELRRYPYLQYGMFWENNFRKV